MSEEDRIKMYIANCEICTLAEAMKNCPICKFKIGLKSKEGEKENATQNTVHQ